MCNSYCQICCNKQLILLKIIITIIAKIGYGVGNFWGLAVKGLMHVVKWLQPGSVIYDHCTGTVKRKLI